MQLGVGVIMYVVDSSVGLLIPQQWHRIPPLIILVSPEINIVQVFAAEELVDRCTLIFVLVCGEFPPGPPLRVPLGIGSNDRYVDDILQAFQVAHEICSMGKWAEQAFFVSIGTSQTNSSKHVAGMFTDVKMIPPRFGLEFAIRRDDAVPALGGAWLMDLLCLA